MITTSKSYGNAGEKLACKYLKKEKYKIVCKNYANSCGEIDIIAIETRRARRRTDDYKKMSDMIKKEDVLCFVEVKSRHSTQFGTPSLAVDKQKQKKYFMVSSAFIKSHKKFSGKQYRYDIIEVVADSVSNHIKNAF